MAALSPGVQPERAANKRTGVGNGPKVYDALTGVGCLVLQT